MLTGQQLHSHSPIKRLLNKLENSIQTYINYHKTHTMATHFGRVGDTPMGNPKTQDVDNVSEDESQDEDLIRQLLCKTTCLKQFVEDRDNEPREVIHGLEQRLNDLTLTLCCPDTPIENVLDRYTKTLCTTQKKTCKSNILFNRTNIFRDKTSFCQFLTWLLPVWRKC